MVVNPLVEELADLRGFKICGGRGELITPLLRKITVSYLAINLGIYGRIVQVVRTVLS